jgi:hypothetical protein
MLRLFNDVASNEEAYVERNGEMGGTVQCTVVGRWRSKRTWRTGPLVVVKWRGLSVYLLGTVTRSALLTVADRRTGPDRTLSLH